MYIFRNVDMSRNTMSIVRIYSNFSISILIYNVWCFGLNTLLNDSLAGKLLFKGVSKQRKDTTTDMKCETVEDVVYNVQRSYQFGFCFQVGWRFSHSESHVLICFRRWRWNMWLCLGCPRFQRFQPQAWSCLDLCNVYKILQAREDRLSHTSWSE